MTLIHLERDTLSAASGYVCNGGYDETDPDSFHLKYSPHTQSVATEIVKAAAFVHNVDYDELEPLASYVDPEALTSVVGPEATDSEIELTFTYEGLEITVNNAGDIWLQWV